MVSAVRAWALSNKQGREAKLNKVKKPSWKAKTNLLRLLLILSTFPPHTKRRSCLKTLLLCLENRKFSATRKLGRLSRPPLMNSLITAWTSREKGKMACSDLRELPSLPDSARTSLRLVQKISGLFDTVKASNMTVASKASKPTMEMDNMDFGETGFMPGMDLGNVLGDMPLELTEADYLDSFMDLSNFLNNEDSLKDALPTASSDTDVEKMKEAMPMDFSGIISNLTSELPVPVEAPEVPTSTKVFYGKRKHVDIVEMALEESMNLDPVSDVVEPTMSDHDYVAKKMKLMSPSVATPSTSTAAKSQPKPSTSKKATDKYRERRDKNNEASRRSRQIRKCKFLEMDREANELEVKNEALRKKITELEALAKTMKAVLIQKMTEKK